MDEADEKGDSWRRFMWQDSFLSKGWEKLKQKCYSKGVVDIISSDSINVKGFKKNFTLFSLSGKR